MGCASSTKVSPIVTEQCKVVATEDIKSPDQSDLDTISTPILYTDSQIRHGVSVSDVVKNQTLNNALWENDRNRLKTLQDYIKLLKNKNIISK